MNVSGILVRVQERDFDEVKSTLEESDFCEVHFCEKSEGKIIVTVEGKGVKEEMDKLKLIQETPRVISADMVHSYSEDELEENMKKMENGDVVPEVLQGSDENFDPKSMVYNGDVRVFTGK